MSSLVAEQLQENALTKTYEIKNIIVTEDQDSIAELAETDEIKKLRKQYKRENEMMYEADRDILSFAHTLSGVAAQKIYVGQEAAVYFEILDTRDFLLKKYAELSTMEAAKYKDKIEPYLKEAEEELAFFESEILSAEARELHEAKRANRFAVNCMKDWLASERIRSEGIATESNLTSRTVKPFMRALTRLTGSKRLK